MNRRRYAVPAALFLGLIGVGATLQITGQISGKSVTGRAAGIGSSSGCSSSALTPPAEVPANIVVAPVAQLTEPAAAPHDLYAQVVPNEFVLKLREGVEFAIDDGRMLAENADLHRTLERLAANQVRPLNRKEPRYANPRRALGLERTLRFSSGRGLNEVVAELEAFSGVEWVEPVSRVRALGIPNDPYFVYQWNLSTLGLPSAWDITEGEGVVVAVVDTGVTAFTDGFLNLLDGFDFVDNDTDAADENGHGTHVSGTIAQSANNGIGVAGVAPQASILPVRVLDGSGLGLSSDLAEGIIWAVDGGAQVINLSLGSSVGSQVVSDAVLYAWENEVVVVAATGNDSSTNFIGFPAAFESVIAVGATDVNRAVTPYSNQGPEIDLVAPGGDVAVDLDGDGLSDGITQETERDGDVRYWVLQGTSVAAPHVAGIAALLISKGTRGPEAVREALVSTANDLGNPGFDHAYGNGIPDPVAALAYSPDAPTLALEIYDVVTEPVGSGRARIRWYTSQPADTLVETDAGVFVQMDAPVRAHSAILRGRVGSTVLATLRSTTGQTAVEEVIEITF